MNSYEKFHLKEVINASGKMTILGVSKVFFPKRPMNIISAS
ncbi:MAG: hypothetical protein ACWM1F_01400 [Enterococcus faecalis]